MSKRYMDFAPKGRRTGVVSRVARTPVQGSRGQSEGPQVQMPGSRIEAPGPQVQRSEPQIQMPERVEIEEEVMVKVLPEQPTEMPQGRRVARSKEEQKRRLEVIKQRQLAQARAEQARRRQALKAQQGDAQGQQIRPKAQQTGAQRPQMQSQGQTQQMRPQAQQMRRARLQQMQREQMGPAPTRQTQTGVRQAQATVRQTPVSEVENERDLEYERALELLEKQADEVKKPAKRRKITGILPKRQAAKDKVVNSGNRVAKQSGGERGTEQGEANLPARLAEVSLSANLLNDPMERPISEFADLEQLAQEIEEVTRNGAVVEEETQFVAAEASFSLKQAPQLGVVEDFQPRFINTEVEKRPLSGAARGYQETARTGVVEAPEAEYVTDSGADDSNSGRNNNKKGFGDARYAVGNVNSGFSNGASLAGVGVGETVGVAATGAVIAAGGFGSADVKKAKQQKVRVRKIKRPVEKPVENFVNAGVRSGMNAGTSAGISTGARAGVNAAQQVKMQIPRAQFINQNKVAKRPLSKTVYENGTSLGTKAPATTKDAPVKVAKSKKKGSTVGMIFAIILTIILGAAVGTVAFLLLPR